MTVPEWAIAGLTALGVCLAAVRIRLAVRAAQARGKKMRRWEIGASKTIGSREVQEDEYGIRETEDGLMAVMADGMGKQFGGKIASRTVVEVFLEVFGDPTAFYNPQYSFRKGFQSANREVLKKLDDQQGWASAAVIMIKDRRLYYAAVGNVKAAVYRNHELVPVTSGHTISVLARQRYEEGKLTRQEAASLLDHHRMYNYVGQDGFRDIEFFDTPISLYGGEYVVLMTDGIYEGVRWKELEDCLESGGKCQDMAFEMVELLNRSEEEDKDNGAVVVVKVG